MKVLFVSRSKTGKPHPFIEEQGAALAKNFHVAVDHFLIRSGGLGGYFQAARELVVKTSRENYDVLHAHYGLSALIAVYNRLVASSAPNIVVTYHGSDLNKNTERPLSLLASRFSSHNIVVSEKMVKYLQGKCSYIPCGIETNVELVYREQGRKTYNWGEEDFVVLFSSSFERKEKDPAFARGVIKRLRSFTTKKVRFIELKGYSRLEVTQLMQAADALIMCSIREGSPQVIKEAIINSLPIVTNDIGEVRSICKGVDNCFVLPKDEDVFARCLAQLAGTRARISNRAPVMRNYDNNIIAARLYDIYRQAVAAKRPALYVS